VSRKVIFPIVYSTFFVSSLLCLIWFLSKNTRFGHSFLKLSYQFFFMLLFLSLFHHFYFPMLSSFIFICVWDIYLLCLFVCSTHSIIPFAQITRNITSLFLFHHLYSTSSLRVFISFDFFYSSNRPVMQLFLNEAQNHWKRK